MQEEKLPFEIFFISGAPRSGTSIAHALICTSADVNNYLGECSYFSQLVRAYDRGVETFDLHTGFYFNTQQEYTDLHRQLLGMVLTAHWHHLGQPRVLVLKDPDMLHIIPSVATLVEQAKFVILYRDPLDVIASRIQVQGRRDPHGNFIHPDNIAGLVDEYVSGYLAIEGLAGKQPQRIFYQNYERLVQLDLAALQKFLGFSDLNPAAVWKDSAVDIKDVAGNPWNSSLYFKPVSSNSVGSYKKVLNAETIRLIKRLSDPLVARLQKANPSSRWR